MAGRGAAAAWLLWVSGHWIVACDPTAQGDAGPVWRDGPTCGDGIVDADADEACDLGFANRADGPCRDCRLPTCGDGVRDPNEACDDGNDDDADACRSDCTATLRERWSRRWQGRAAAERVADLVVDASGDAIAVGHRDANAEGHVRPWVTRYSPGGDARWSVALGDFGVARAIAQHESGDLVVAVTSALLPDTPGELRVFELALADGSVRLDVTPADEAGQAAGIATAGDAVFVAYNEATGTARVLGLDAAGQVESSYASAEVPRSVLRALAILPGGDLVVGGESADASRGFVARVSAAGEPRFLVDELDGPVIDVAAAGEGMLAALTARIAGSESTEPWTWTTAVEVVAFALDGTLKWSTRLGAAKGRREAGALAWTDRHIVVVGADPWPTATCAPYHCEQRSWAAALDPDDGSVTWELVLDPGVQGRAHAVGIRESTLVVGGEVRALFSATAGFVSGLEEAPP